MLLIADLFCGTGGAAMGIHLACEKAGIAHRIVGYDIKPMPRYPFEFVQQNALTVNLTPFDAVWASPPCQGYSIMNNLPWLRGRDYPLLILPTLEMLEALGKPYVLENVMGARHGAKGLSKRGLEAHGLKAGWLCGRMFGLPFYRHRLFATNWAWMQPGHPKHRLNLHPHAERWVYGGTVKGLPGGAAGLDVKPRENPVNTAWREYHDGQRQYIRKSGAQSNGVDIGHAKGWRLAAEAMGIDWMNCAELTQAIPPVFSEYVWSQLLKHLREEQEE